jgi:K+-sensing histidine kinase KdpD
LVGALYAATVLLISGQKWSELSITIVMTQVVAMFIVASISSSLVKAIYHQRELAHREQTLSTQLNHQVNALSALNRLSERLNASLNSEELMQSTLEILPDALDVDAAVGLLARHDEAGKWDIDSVWYGIDEAFTPAENVLRGDESDLVQAGPLVLSRSDLERVLVQGQPLRFPLPREAELEEFSVTSLREPAVLIVPLRSEAESSGVLALLRQNGPAFEQSDQELLAALGRHLAVLLKNARLYELERQNVARLQELEQMKSDFLSAVSHELRTPLTSIKASTILLLSQPDEEVNATELTLYKNIDRNTERLNGFVTDLLDLAKLQNGRLRLSLQSVNPVEIIQDVIASLHPLTDSKKQVLTARLPAALPVVTADHRRVEQILTNLVSNAQRYTPRGSLIEVSAWEEAGEVIIKLRDNGPGIDPAEQALFFEKFYRSHSQQGKGGTGLGLAIARSLVELHNGRIWLESALGEGSSFYFTLPANQ